MEMTVSEILREEFMEPFGISAYRLAKDINVPVSRIHAILNGNRKITVDTSIRLGRYFGVSYEYFLNIQNAIDIREASNNMAEDIKSIKEHEKMGMIINGAIYCFENGGFCNASCKYFSEGGPNCEDNARKIAIDAMRKYQKIQEIYKRFLEDGNYYPNMAWLDVMRVVEDRNEKR